MAEKNLRTKTTKRWGKGGNLVSLILIFTLIFQPVAFASRSSAGGGKIEKFNAGRVLNNLGIGLGAIAVGSALNSAISSAQPVSTSTTTLGSSLSNISTTSTNLLTNTAGQAGGLTPLQTFGNSLVNSCNLTNIAINYNTFVAASQVGRAIGMAGSYYGWKPSTTFIVSSFGTAATAGFLNPTVVVGDALPDAILNSSGNQALTSVSFPMMTQGAFVGGLTGLASGAATAAIDGDRINKNKEPGVGAQIAGLAAGVAAANFSKELIKPTAPDYVVRREKWNGNNVEIDKLDNPIDEILDPGHSLKQTIGQARAEQTKAPLCVDTDPYRYYNVTGVDLDFSSRSPFSEVRLSSEEVKAMAGNFKPIGEDIWNVVPVHQQATAQGLLNATFVKTADIWPTFATSAIGLNAAKALGKNNKWAEPLVRYSAEGIAGPLFSGAAQIYGLQPSLYLGRNTVVNRIGYQENMNQMLYAKKSGEINAELQKVKYTGDNKAYQEGLQEVLDKYKLGVKADVVYDTDDLINIKQVDLINRAGSLSPTEYQNETSQLADLQKQFNAHPEQFNAQEAMRGVAFSKARQAVESQLKDVPTLADRFEIVGANRAGLLLDNTAKQEMVFGALEGVIHGGMSSLANKISEHNYPSKAIAVSYGAALLAGAANGALKYALWEESWDKKGNLSWGDKYELYAPQPYKGDDWFMAKLSDNTDNLREYNEFAGYVGQGRYILEDRPIVDASGATTYVKTPGYRLNFSKPDLRGAVLSGMSQANRQFLNRAFSFGAPQAMPADINSFATVQYLNSLKGYTVAASQPNGFSAVLERSYVDAASQAAANNVLSSMATVKPLAEMFNIQQERLVKTDSLVSPYALQKKYYQRELDNVVVTTEIPYPNDTNTGPQSGTGKSYKENYLGR